jgi:hypothetical protein
MLVGDSGVIEPNLSVTERGDASVAADAMRTGHRVCPGVEGDADSLHDAGVSRVAVSFADERCAR